MTLPLYITLLLVFAIRQLVRWKTEAFIPIGKSIVVIATALTWQLAIVTFNSDWAFTLLNVLPHGIPYLVLVWQRSHGEGNKSGTAGALLKAGPVVFGASGTTTLPFSAKDGISPA